jgi:cytoskeletal protein CcmA (bactofilin family)
MQNIVTSWRRRPASKSPTFSCIISLSLFLLLAFTSMAAQALYSFPAAAGAPMPPGCTGSAGVYTCANSLNIQDQVQFLDTGNVTVTFNNLLTIGGFTLGSPTQAANVTLVTKGLLSMSFPTIYASISAGNNSIITTAAAFVKGNLTTTNGSITVSGTVTGNVSATGLGSVVLLSNAVVNGNITGATGLVTLNSNAVVNGNISTSTGAITLSGGNNISSTVNCSACTLIVNGPGNVLGADISVGNVAGVLSSNTSYNGAIIANLSSIVLGSGSTVAGNITATSTGLGVSYISALQSVINGSVTASSQVSAQLFLYSGSVVHGAVQMSNAGALLAAVTTNVFVDNSSEINNSVSVTGVIDNWGKISGCARTTSSYMWAIVMEYNSTTTGVCCFNGSKCSTTSCVANLWSYKVNGCSTPANKFTCIDPSISNTNAASGHLYTQVANTAFNADVVALAADSSVNTTYVSKGDNNKTVTLKFVDCGDPAILANQTCAGAIAEINTQNVTFTSTDNGRKTISTTIANAYKNIRCQVTDSNANNPTSRSTDNFAVRPEAFTSVTSNANADSLLGQNISASPAIKAGSTFTLTAATGLSNYSGTPKIDTTRLAIPAGATSVGQLAGLFSDSANGSASGSNFTYSETGYFRFEPYAIYDDTYTQVDAANGDCATGFLPQGGMQACAFGHVPLSAYYYGRFVPDHLLVTPGPGMTQACGAFSYYGQGTATTPGLITPFILTAKNAAGDTTQNYIGSPLFLLPDWSKYQFSATPLNGAALSSGLNLPPVTGNWVKGVANIVAAHTLSRPATPVSPQIITLSAQPQYIDAGVTISSSKTTLSSNVTYLYGRLNVQSAHGSELLALPLLIEAQYWNGSAYVRSAGDNCTALPLNSIALKNYKGNLAACETYLSGSPSMSNGKLGLKLTAPGIGNDGQPNTGSVDIAVNLGTLTPGDQTCLSSSPTSATAGILSPWFGNTAPNARATFGIYKTPVIYMRESF